MKTNRLSILAIILLCSSIFLATTQTARAQTVVAGVSKGETFDYSYSLIWASTDPSATPPKDLVEYNNTQQIQFKITDVSGSILTVDFIRHFKNGTQSVESGTINIQSGLVTVPYGFLIIGANLTKNQRIYPSGGYQTITDTVTRSYPSGQRETNVISGEDSSQKTAIYFDKIKGIAVDYSYEIRETSGGYTITTIERLISTNADVWTVASAPTPTPTATGISPTPTPTPTTTTTPTTTGILPTPTTAHAPTATAAAFVFSAVDWLIVIAVIIIVLILIILAWYRRRRKPKTQQTQTTYLGTF